MLKSKLSSASVVCVDLEKLDRWLETALMFYVFVFGFQGRPQAGAAGPSLLAHPGHSHDDLRVHRCPCSPPLSPFISLLIQHVTLPVLVLAVVIHPHCLLSGASFTKTSFNILIDQILYLPDSPGSSPLCSASRFHSVRVALHDSQLKIFMSET